MKSLKKTLVSVFVLALLLTACSPENVSPQYGNNEPPKLSGSAEDPHPALDTVCQIADTVFFVREDNGSAVIDKCFGFGGVPIACPPNQMRWGYLEMLEGYLQDTNYVDCDFTMAPGWYCNFDNWLFGISTSYQFDNNGIPLITSDWGSRVVNPVQNRWHLRVRVGQVPEPCFQLAMRITAVRVNLFGAVVAGSSTTLWGQNRNWNTPGHPRRSASPWLTPFCPVRCLQGSTGGDNVPPVFSACPSNRTVSQCNSVTYQVTATDNVGTPTFTYAFSGATTGSGAGTGSGANFNPGTTTVTITARDGSGNTSNCVFTVTVLAGNLTDYLLVFTDGRVDANWQGATKGFVGNAAVNGILANERTSGSVPYTGVISTNDNNLGAWQGIVNANSGRATASFNESATVSALTTELENTFTHINAMEVTQGYAGVSSTSLNNLNTQDGIGNTFVINVTSGFQISSKINITGDANDIFILRWDTDQNFSNGYNGQVKFQSGGAIVPLGGLKPSNFFHVAGDIGSSGGGSNPNPPYPQGPRANNGQGSLITGGTNFNGGGFFTGYWFTTGSPTIMGPGQPFGQTSSLSNAIFVGGWYSKTTKFSMTSGTSGVYVGCN